MTFQEFIERHENQALEIDIQELQPQVYSKYLDLKLQLENADFEKEKKKALKEVKDGITFFKKRILNFLKNDHFTTKYIGMTPPYIEHLRLYLMYKQLHSVYGEPTRKPEQEQPETLGSIITHKEAETLVSGIKTQYKNIKGKRLKLLLIALQELELLPKERIAKKFHALCKNEFNWEIASYNAMNGYNFNRYTDTGEVEGMKQYIKTLLNIK